MFKQARKLLIIQGEEPQLRSHFHFHFTRLIFGSHSKKLIETHARMKDGGKYFGGVYAAQSYEITENIDY